MKSIKAREDYLSDGYQIIIIILIITVRKSRDCYIFFRFEQSCVLSWPVRGPVL